MKNKTSSTAVFVALSLGLIWTLIFGALKLAHVIDWSWWIVAGPFLFMFALVVCVVIYIIVVLKDA